MNTTKRVLEYTPDPNKFDLSTHRWDSQGNLTKKNPYRMFMVGDRTVFERPVNSGNLWGENNQPAGRVEIEFSKDKPGVIAKKSFDFEAPHKEYKAPLSGSDKLHYELEQEKEKTAALERELAQIRASKGQPVSAVQEGFPADEKKSEKRGR